MSTLTHKELTWFRLANANPATGFYPFKHRFLKRYAVRDGWDLQRIEKECWSCDGSGEYAKGEKCRSCSGSGVHHVNENWLERWILQGHVYHIPYFCSPTHREREGQVRHEIEGRIQHEPVSASTAQRSFYRLLLRHEPVTFYQLICDRIKSKCLGHRMGLAWRLVRLRNKLDLFPAVPEDEVPF